MKLRRDETTDARRRVPRFGTALAEDQATVQAAQRLRYRVFAAERSARQDTAAGVALDQDHFDPYCRHLVVRDTASGDVVGTYRILTPEGARDAGGFYSETEFDLTRIRALDLRLVEVGRACVDPTYRGGAVIAMLLAGLTRYVVAERYDYVVGCASFDLRQGVAAAAAGCQQLLREHRGPDAWQAVPHKPFRPSEQPSAAPFIPPLVRTYLRLGATVCGEPAWDEAFATADVLMMLPMASMAPRFRARLLRDDPAGRPRRRTRWAA